MIRTMRKSISIDQSDGDTFERMVRRALSESGKPVTTFLMNFGYNVTSAVLTNSNATTIYAKILVTLKSVSVEAFRSLSKISDEDDRMSGFLPKLVNAWVLAIYRIASNRYFTRIIPITAVINEITQRPIKP